MRYSRLEAAPFDPEDLHGLRARVNAETGGGYATFRNALKPYHARVWRDIAGGYAALAASVTLVGMAGLLTAPLGAILIGFFVAYLQLFIHEAAHYGLAKDREANDWLANCLICWQVGTDIASYRATHWEHHRSLGGPGDTEVSYRNRLTLSFTAAMVTGLHAVRVFLSRKPGSKEALGRSRWPLIRGAATHAAILAGLVVVGWWAAAMAWVAGMGIIFPFFATMRQLLEHRPMAGDGGGTAVTRLFGDGPFACLFGGAGFNRHMLHHLEPQVSYTRLAQLEAYLMMTSAREELDARRGTYWRTLASLIRSDRRD
jgi:fatty acid desaturase